jgi:hypothetical protein
MPPSPPEHASLTTADHIGPESISGEQRASAREQPLDVKKSHPHHRAAPSAKPAPSVVRAVAPSRLHVPLAGPSPSTVASDILARLRAKVVSHGYGTTKLAAGSQPAAALPSQAPQSPLQSPSVQLQMASETVAASALSSSVMMADSDAQASPSVAADVAAAEPPCSALDRQSSSANVSSDVPDTVQERKSVTVRSSALHVRKQDAARKIPVTAPRLTWDQGRRIDNTGTV